MGRGEGASAPRAVEEEVDAGVAAAAEMGSKKAKKDRSVSEEGGPAPGPGTQAAAGGSSAVTGSVVEGGGWSPEASQAHGLPHSQQAAASQQKHPAQAGGAITKGGEAAALPSKPRCVLDEGAVCPGQHVM